MTDKRCEHFKKRGIEKHAGRFDYSRVDYQGSFKKVTIGCPEHGWFEIKPVCYLQSEFGCQKCGREYKNSLQRMSEDEFRNRSNLKHNNFYDYSITKFTGIRYHVDINCPIHGAFSQNAWNHINGCGCPICGRLSSDMQRRHPREYYIALFEEKHNKRYKYDHQIEPILYDGHIIVTCPDHGDFRQPTSSHIIGGGCPKCNNSYGETLVSEILKELGIDYIREYRYRDCRNINELPFDFYLPNENILIEYDGQQHFESVEFFGGIEGFQRIKLHDSIKDNYARTNGIPLLRVRYDQGPVEIADKIAEFIMDYVN